MFRPIVSVLLTTVIGFAAADSNVPQYFQTSPELFAGKLSQSSMLLATE